MKAVTSAKWFLSLDCRNVPRLSPRNRAERAAHLSSLTVITPSSFGIRTAALTASWCPSILFKRTGLELWGLECISAAMALCFPLRGADESADGSGSTREAQQQCDSSYRSVWQRSAFAFAEVT